MTNLSSVNLGVHSTYPFIPSASSSIGADAENITPAPAASISNRFLNSTPLPSRSSKVSESSTPPECIVVGDNADFSLVASQVAALSNAELAKLDATRLKCPIVRDDPETGLPREDPLSALSVEELQTYYGAAINANRALELQESVAGVEIGHALVSLTPAIRRYMTDQVALESTAEEMRLIEREFSRRNIYHLDWHMLSSFRSLLSPNSELSVVDREMPLFSRAVEFLGGKGRFQEIAIQFTKDPSSLLDGRLLGNFPDSEK